MKKAAIILLSIIAFYGCKKEATTKSIQMQITVPANTTYNINVTDGNSPLLGINNQSTNFSYTLVAKSGDKLTVVYGFITGGQQYGQGVVTFDYNSQVLLTIKGGNGTQTVTVP